MLFADAVLRYCSNRSAGRLVIWSQWQKEGTAMQVDSYLIWLIAGLVLIITELTSGTFYLLVLGVAAVAGAGSAWLGGAFWVQTLCAAGVAIAGVWWVHQHHKASNTVSMPSLEAGQPVTFESWVNQAGGTARVKYRGAEWDAVLPAGESPAAGDIYYISAVDRSTLILSKSVGMTPP
jgi:membrane protein implicated in regulation of membrane protease activity